MKRYVLVALVSLAAVGVFPALGLQAQEVDGATSVELVDGGFVDFGNGNGDGFSVTFPSEREVSLTEENAELIDPPADRGGEDCADCRDLAGAEPAYVSAAPDVVAALVVLMSDEKGGLAAAEYVDCRKNANPRRSVCLSAMSD